MCVYAGWVSSYHSGGKYVVSVLKCRVDAELKVAALRTAGLHLCRKIHLLGVHVCRVWNVSGVRREW